MKFMSKKKGKSRSLASQYRNKKFRRRLIWLAVILCIIGLRFVSFNRRSSFKNLPINDYERYHNRVFTCVKVIDGDTIDIDVPDPKSRRYQRFTRIRMWGIDTPEIAHYGHKAMYFGYEAAEFARKLLAGKKVRLELVKGRTRGYYGRLLAYVYLPDGRMYNRLAIEKGYAYADYRFKHPYLKEFLKLEEQARRKRVGLWAGVSPKDLPHWYRKSKLKEFWKHQHIK